MAVPKKKTTPSRRNMRRSHHALSKSNVLENPTTGEYQLPHHVSLDGFYKGRYVFDSAASNEDETVEETL